jgi:hypothetical protein
MTFKPRRQPYLLKPITILQVLVEITVILFCVFYYTRHLQDFSENRRLHGNEFSYLMSSGTIAHVAFRENGAIPLWNPFVGPGEPLMENPFSYTLNPLMTWPVLTMGPVNGSKVAILIHIALFGIGGWLLGRTLRMGMAGRLTLALMLAGSGSFAGTIGDGFYQMGLSQAYMPWILAGTIGTLYLPEKRWPVVVLAVSTTLMVFAGTFWHLLPTAIGCAVLVFFAVVYWDSEKKQIRIDGQMALRVVIAGIFMVGLGAVRLLPQAINSNLVDHPYEWLNESFKFENILQRYFQTTPPVYELRESIQHYHYMMTFTFFVGVVIARALVLLVRAIILGKREPIKPGIWRILIPLLIMFVFLNAWSQGGVPFTKWLYETIGIFRQWRYVGRVGASAVLWLALFVALSLDDISDIIRAVLIPKLEEGIKVTAFMRVGRLVGRVAGVAVVAVGLIASQDTLNNLPKRVGLDPVRDVDAEVLAWLRDTYPDQFLAVSTPGFFGYFPFYTNLIRAAFGNPDYRPHGRPPTMGVESLLLKDNRLLPAQYAATVEFPFTDYLTKEGYSVVPDAPRPIGGNNHLWYNPKQLSYAFTVTKDRIVGRRGAETLLGSETLSVTTIDHRLDKITLQVGGWPENSVLIVAETSYPGWVATIKADNREPIPVIVESIADRIGVQLPNDAQNAEIVFEYRPTLFVSSAVFSGVFFLIFVFYTLQIDRRIPASVYAALRKRARGVAEPAWEGGVVVGRVIAHQLARTDIFEPVREGRPPMTLEQLKALPVVATPNGKHTNGTNGKNGKNGAHEPEPVTSTVDATPIPVEAVKTASPEKVATPAPAPKPTASQPTPAKTATPAKPKSTSSSKSKRSKHGRRH